MDRTTYNSRNCLGTWSLEKKFNIDHFNRFSCNKKYYGSRIWEASKNRLKSWFGTAKQMFITCNSIPLATVFDQEWEIFDFIVLDCCLLYFFIDEWLIGCLSSCIMVFSCFTFLYGCGAVVIEFIKDGALSHMSISASTDLREKNLYELLNLFSALFSFSL